MISTRLFCHTPTQEYVVPRSIPIAIPPSDAIIYYRYKIKVRFIILNILYYMYTPSLLNNTLLKLKETQYSIVL